MTHLSTPSRAALATIAAAATAASLLVAIPATAQAASTVRATSAVNVRQGPGLNYATVGALAGGQSVTATGQKAGRWVQVVYGGSTKWVSGTYLSSATVYAAPAVSGNASITGYSRLTPNAKRVAAAAQSNFPRVRNIYGWRASSAVAGSDHPGGRAVDIMLPRGTSDAAYGWSIANYFRANSGRYAVKYIMFRQQVWTPSGGWRGMENRGNATANHYDHVHVSVR